MKGWHEFDGFIAGFVALYFKLSGTPKHNENISKVSPEIFGPSLMYCFAS